MDRFPSKKKAQERVDRIRAFQNELQEIEGSGLIRLPYETRRLIESYHADLIARFKRQFDTDTTAAEKQLSLGMRILTFLGGLALCASIFFFFYQIWGLIPESVQIVSVIALPILAVLTMTFAAHREPSHYYASLIGLVAFIGFVLNLNVMGSLYNITPSQNAFLVWGAFAVVLAYRFGLRLLLLAGLLCLLAYLSATVGAFSGIYWLHFGERPENFIFGGLVLLALPLALEHRQYPHFVWFYHLVGLLSIHIALLIMSYCGHCSYLLAEENLIEVSYQVATLAAYGITVWLGVRFHYTGITHIGTTFCTLFFYTKFFDWWWDALPKSLFFFVLSLITIGLLVLFRNMRNRFREAI
ncbi:DUF2157 domain-containing protein [Nitrospina gracilis]|uniref:DUF2157 domain-containing protein n=1 Tax=Nitrospina gracilis TaxID=35801 RepID=UPI001F243335|nr:DUF2157 domain-containing protein [Nitrospina gracilis]MCF8720659.1 membrane-associated HD superfamily phosphohydrolase [Nitrospina gracilis Nb-211]